VPAFLIAIAGAAAAQSGAAQTGSTATPAGQNQPPVFRSEANFVRVDVYPLRDGTPVEDLRAEDFEVIEDGTPQSVQTFEHILIRPAGPQAQRVEPNSIEASRQMAANARSRVFVIFLDTPHVTIGSSWNIREPLIRLVERMLGPDDLVGIMTPAMSAADLVLARKTEVLAANLRSLWPWGNRDVQMLTDEREILYESCYPPSIVPGVAAEMIARRRERATLDALVELGQYLRTLREERKAILTVSEGWELFGEDQSLTTLRTSPLGAQERMPGVDPIGVGPDGRLTTKNPRNSLDEGSKATCDGDRQRLSLVDDIKYFREVVLSEANRANASFYTIDPRGLAVWDSPTDRKAPITSAIAHLAHLQDSMRTLAENTDGFAVMNSNNFDAGLKRIAGDLTSYYLLGYYSTNTKLDGRFRSIKVRVKRPGVTVRARPGYNAATAKEVSAARAAAPPPVPTIASTMAAAIGTLDRVRPDARFHVNAVTGMLPGATTIWVAGELLPGGAGDTPVREYTADVEVRGANSSGTARVTLAPGDRGFTAPVTLSRAVESGTLDVRVRLTGGDGRTEQAATIITVDPPGLGRPLIFRRGPTTANRLRPAATFRFSRAERARLELPIAAGVTPGAGRLLDRTGQPLAVPITIGERADDQSGQRWLTAEISLASLAAGDYGIEVTATATGGEQRSITAIRVER